MENGAGKVVGGARRLVVGKGMTRNAMEMMMTRKVPEKTIKKPIKKRSRGAKSKIQKGKFMEKTDSSQQGIEQCWQQFGLGKLDHSSLKQLLFTCC